MTAEFLTPYLAFDRVSMAAILLMGLVTYFTRIGGFLMMRRVPEGGFFARWLAAIPGAVLIAILAPTIWHTGWLERAALVLVAILSLLGANPLVAVAVGTASVAAGRTLL